jgi:hypothetical protein
MSASPVTDYFVLAHHGEYFNSWGHPVIEFSCGGFLTPILHSSFEGAGRAKSNAGLT